MDDTARNALADYVEAHVTVAGGGEPLLLVHGLGHSAVAWDGVVERLADDFTVAVVDLPGFGGAAPLPGTPDDIALAAHLSRVMDLLGWATAHVAGNSLGGLIAVRLAEARRARSVTAFSPAGMVRGWEHLWTRTLLNGVAALSGPASRVGVLSSTPTGRRLLLSPMFGRPADVSPAYARAAMRQPGRASSFHATLRAIPEVHDLAPIEVPVTIAWGTRDRLLFPSHGRRWQAVLPAARLVRLQGLGHLPMGEDPEVCANLVRVTAGRRGAWPALGPRRGAPAKG